MKPLLSLALLAAILAGCAGERVVLLPDPEGRATALVVRSGQQELVLDRPYAAALRQAGAVSAYTATPAEVAERFGAALAAQPARAASFVVYFVEGRDELTPESLPELDRLKAELAARPAPEITVVGHTDRVGGVAANDALSLRRAQSVKETLVAAGLPEGIIETAGRGEREPLVPTADEVAEPRNRRVEITVR